MRLLRKFKYDKIFNSKYHKLNIPGAGFPYKILLRIYQGNVNVKLSRKFKYEIIKEM